MLKGGIIGFGTSGREFTDYINKHCTRARIVAACNRGQANLDAAVKEYGLRGLRAGGRGGEARAARVLREAHCAEPG